MAKLEIKKDGNIILRDILVEAGKKDSHGDTILLKGLIMPDLNKFSRMFVSKDFSHNPKDIIGGLLGVQRNLKTVTSSLEIFLPEGYVVGEYLTLIGSLYPAIGGKILERDGDKITKCELTQISLCAAPNKDRSIPSIGEQLGEFEVDEDMYNYKKPITDKTRLNEE